MQDWEKELIRRNYGRIPAADIGLKIGRTGQAVRQFASKDGLTKGRGHNVKRGGNALTEAQLVERGLFYEWLLDFERRHQFATREEIEEYEELAEIRFRRITGRKQLDANQVP